ncbi:MAG: tripartite tricarboxylate transporter substrate binding protein [Rhodobacteraceae bacterium]|nr:tripartite tricarboxylate transporter substrate binding protein [Paracoccaceae bacterium]
MNRRQLLAGVISAVTIATAASAELPEGTITIIVPYGPGGATDLVARVVAESMSSQTGRTVIVDNRPGAFGIAAMEYVAAAPSDGTTLLMQNVTTASFSPVLYASRMTFDPFEGFQPVTRIAKFNGVYVASTASTPAFTSMNEMMDWAREHPGELRIGNVGANSIPHLDALTMTRGAGVEANHIPATSGASGMVADLINGDLHVAGLNESGAANLVAAGQGVALMVAADSELPSFPGVPTAAELGYESFSGQGNWQAIFVNSDVPAETVASLNDAIRAAVLSPEAQERLANSNATIFLSETPEEFGTWFQAEVADFRVRLADLGIEAQ